MKVTGRKATTGGGRGGGDARARTGGPSGSAGGSLGKLPEEATLGLHLKKKQEVSQAGRGRAGAPVPWGRPATWASNRSSVGRTAVFR